MTQDAAERPTCKKCSGSLHPNRDPITGRVASVTCACCGETLYRDHERRLPELKEKDLSAGKGSARHALPKASHKKRAAA